MPVRDILITWTAADVPQGIGATAPHPHRSICALDGSPVRGFFISAHCMDYLSLLQQPFLKTQVNTATKSVDLSPLGDYWYTARKDEDAPDPAELFRSVAWLARAVELRSNAVAAMPFRIATKGGADYDISDDYQNKLGFLPNPRRLLYLTEAALCCAGMAYYWRERNRVITTGLRYIRWDTVEPQIDGAAGLTGFIRKVNGQRISVPVEGITYFWLPDPYIELGPPLSSPVMAALAASGVLNNLDKFAAAYFARGAIKATLLTVTGNPPQAEKDRLKTWWGKFMTGNQNSFSSAVVNADAVTPVIVGEGLAELSNATLTAEKRQDIATALGVPQSVIFSESASGLGGGGVAAQDEAHFYSKTIIPECNLIADTWNEQILAPLGYRLEFRAETLDVFQEDENQRAAAFSAYVAAGLPIEVVGPMLGIELPAGWDWDKLAKLKEERAAQMQAQMQPAGGQSNEDTQDDEGDEGNDLDAKALADLRRWRTKSAKRGRLAQFESDWIPAPVMDNVRAHGDNGWRDALDSVIAVYGGETVEPEPVNPAPEAKDVSELVDALRAATEALKHGQPVTE